MIPRSLICLHGYGVRGFFWNPVRQQLEEAFPELLTPDLSMNSVASLIANTRALIKSKSDLDRAPVCVLGHSLGGIVAAICARDLGPKVISRVAIIGSPYGVRTRIPSRFTLFLMRHKLMPDIITRPKFFSPQTPPEKQKELFERAVPENAELQHELFQPVWFHTDMFGFPLKQPSLVVYSTRDRIVSACEAIAFGEALGSEFIELGPNNNVGHDDFIWAPAVAASLMPRIISFLKR